MKKKWLRSQVALAVRACQGEKGRGHTVLQLDEVQRLHDYFPAVLGFEPAPGAGHRRRDRLSPQRYRAQPNIRGYTQADWLLMDYVDFVVHMLLRKRARILWLSGLCGRRPTRVELAAPGETCAQAWGPQRRRSPGRAAAKAGKRPAKSAARKRAPAKRTRKSSGP